MRQKLPQKHPIQQPTQHPEKSQYFNPSPEGLSLKKGYATQSDILHLQRTIGNSAVQRLLASHHITTSHTPPANPVIQRTGLRDEDSAGAFNSSVKAYFDDPANKKLTIEKFLKKVDDAVITALGALDIPPIKMVAVVGDDNEKGGSYASFDLKTWEISFTMSGAFKPTNHVSDLTEANIGEMINSLYHEARHAEQQFRVAQMLAGQKIPKEGNITSKHRKDAQNHVMSEMTGMPTPIVKRAVENPIYDSPTGDNQAFEEAQKWYDEVYGKDQEYRKEILFIKDKIMPVLSDNLDKAIDKLDKGAQEYDLYEEIGYIQGYSRELLNHEDPLRTELTRIQAIVPAQQTANDVTMQVHLEQLLSTLASLEALGEITFNNVRNVEPYKILINKELYSAYRDFPTEDDAWKTGNLAQSTFLGTPPQ